MPAPQWICQLHLKLYLSLRDHWNPCTHLIFNTSIVPAGVRWATNSMVPVLPFRSWTWSCSRKALKKMKPALYFKALGYVLDNHSIAIYYFIIFLLLFNILSYFFTIIHKLSDITSILKRNLNWTLSHTSKQLE